MKAILTSTDNMFQKENQKSIPFYIFFFLL